MRTKILTKAARPLILICAAIGMVACGGPYYAGGHYASGPGPYYGTGTSAAVVVDVRDRPYYTHGPSYYVGRSYYVWRPGHVNRYGTWIPGHYVLVTR